MKPKNFGPIRSREELDRIAIEICDYAGTMYPHLYGMELRISTFDHPTETMFEFIATVQGRTFLHKFMMRRNEPPFDSVNQFRYMADQFIAYMNKEIGTVPDKALIDLLQGLL